MFNIIDNDENTDTSTRPGPARWQPSTRPPRRPQARRIAMTEEVAERLRALRKRHGLSQRELAKQAGLTNGSVSLIEQGKVSPSVGSLKKLLDCFPVSLAEFFTMDVADSDDFVFRRDQQPDLGQGDLGLFLIGAGLPDRRLTVLREVMKPGTDTGPDMLTHAGEESGVIIQGVLELTVGERVERLRRGDGYYFASQIPHRFRNVGSSNLIIVSANTPPSF